MARSLLYLLVLLLPLGGAAAQTAEAPPDPYVNAIDGAEAIGDGAIRAFRKGPQLLLELPEDTPDRLFLWYVEGVGLPLKAEASGIGLRGVLVRFEEIDGSLIARDMSGPITRRRGHPEPYEPRETDAGTADDPVAVSVGNTAVGPVIAAFPVIGRSPAGRLLIDGTAVFSADLPQMSARELVLRTGMLPQAPDPRGSWISRVVAHDIDIDIRTHLTFLAANPANPAAGPAPVSVTVGHSLVLLRRTPVRSRAFDPRVGFFATRYTAFETADGGLLESGALIERYPLVKRNPDQAVSDPVEPIVFYIGQDVPARWRPWIRRAVESWLPVFEAAGFSNAIIARDAPTATEDPTWSDENVNHSVIRWLSQPRANAMGPHTVDPRSGEILSAHILVWPQVIEYVERYYFALFGAMDPRAARLPLPEDLRGEILQYVVAHEVGHTIGLRHNHLASTAWSCAHLRDPGRVDTTGPNSSIMAYGRMNQAAQPGDGVSGLLGRIGPYDYAAISWGYGDFGATAAEEQRGLDDFAAAMAADRTTMWGVAEFPDEIEHFGGDPRVQRENVGVERVEATRLGIANLMRSLARLDEATGGDARAFRAALDVFLLTHSRFLKSAGDLVGGVYRGPLRSAGETITVVPRGLQAEAVAYLLGEGAASLDRYRDRTYAGRAYPLSGELVIDDLQAQLITGLLAGPTLKLLALQGRRSSEAYWIEDFAEDVHEAVWGDLSDSPPWKQALQRAYLDRAGALLDTSQTDGPGEAEVAAAATAQGFSPAFARLVAETGDDTPWPAWVRRSLPELASRLDRASTAATDGTAGLHFAAMAHKAKSLID
ncbi:MAG: zinc-dependent metalloprotease [Minwuia sp.]|uniref:zinc-dependent metalloprotease n=1 Tax=Minwuia sp. TaxID=2493630 RepID=UPI003A848765